MSRQLRMSDSLQHDDEQLSLAELVNRVLDRGAVISGDVVVSVAGIDLIFVGLRVLLSSVETMRDRVEPR